MRPEANLHVFTRREQQIIRLYSEGMFDKQIGRRLGLAASTVRSHLASVCNKIGASHRLQCGMILERLGFTRDVPLPRDEPLPLQSGSAHERATRHRPDRS